MSLWSKRIASKPRSLLATSLFTCGKVTVMRFSPWSSQLCARHWRQYIIAVSGDILIEFSMRFTHRNKAIGLPLKPAPKMYDEQMLEKESKGEIVCVMSNIWFDLYEPKELGKKKARIPQVHVVYVCLSFLLLICRSVCARLCLYVPACPSLLHFPLCFCTTVPEI